DPTPSLQPHYEPSSLLRVGPSQCSASVRWPSRFFAAWGLLPWHQSDWFLQFHVTAYIRFTPSLRRSPPAQSSGTLRTLFPGEPYAPGFDDTWDFQRRVFKGSLAFVSRMLTCTSYPRAFLPTLTTTALYRSSLEWFGFCS